MKACPVCGLDLEDTYLFCPEDGSPLERPDTSVLANKSPENRTEVASIEESNANPAGPVVLYCPACAAEYPLTFSDCPVHGIPLTKHRIPTFVEPPARVVQQTSEPHLGEKNTPSHQQAQSPASYSSVIVSDHVDSIPVNREDAQEPLMVVDEIEDQTPLYEPRATVVEETDREPKSFKVAAIMIVVSLAVLSLVALYAFYSNVTRKPASKATRPGNNSPVSTPESAFIPTPEAALDYKEEPPATSNTATDAAKDESQGEKEPARIVAAAPSKEPLQKVEERKTPSSSTQPPPVAAQTPVAVKRPASATDLVLPRGTYGLVDARLIRMRARQTPSGYRYDLTFNLQEQAGRVTQYDRIAVVTRSASGINHSEVMPFYHRLGAAGDLTFTISVEMRGRSEADWQGRIICTGTGTDNQGKQLRTSFGANVSP
jgi:hypothetical protein